MTKLFLTITCFVLSISNLFSQNRTTSRDGNLPGTGTSVPAQLPDSLAPLEDVIVYANSDPERAEKVMESYLGMEPKVRQELYPDGMVHYIQGDYLYARGQYSSSIGVFEKLLDDPYISGSDSLTMRVLDRMMEASRMINDFDNTMRYALRMLDIAKEADDKSQIGRAYMFMGKTQYRAGDKNQALRYFELAEENLTAGRDPKWLSHFYLTLANIYIEYEDLEKSYHYALLYEQSLDRLTQSGSKNELFIEIYRGRAYIMLAEILFNMGHSKEASEYYDKFRGTWNATDPDEGIFIVPYLLSAGRYSEAEPYVLRNEAHMRQSGDTINDNMLNVKRFLQYIHYNLGNIEKSYDYLQQRNIITNRLRRSENQSSAIEIAAIYETAEREATIAAQKEEIRLRKMYTLTALIISLLLSGLLITIIFFNRTLSRKNKRLVDSIQQQLLAKEQPVAVTDETPDDTGASAPNGKKNGQQLFQKIEWLMHTEKLYLNKGLLRDDVVNILGTNKNYLIEAIQAFTGMNFTDYVNSLRLEHSLGLLSGTDEIISAVAAKSGFGSVSSYHRLFTDKYGISPNTYRRLLKKDHK